MRKPFREFAVRNRSLPAFVLSLAIGVMSLCAAGPSLADGGRAFSPVLGSPPATRFVLSDMDGKTVDLDKLRGKLVLINFWATWCPPCRKEMPSLQRLWKKLGGSGLQVVAVNVGEDADTVFAFMGILENSPTFPIVFDKDSEVMRKWPIRGLPTTFLVDKNGKTIYRAIGGREFDSPEIVEFIKKQLIEQNIK